MVLFSKLIDDAKNRVTAGKAPTHDVVYFHPVF
jgi:hypothetical protein